MDNTLLRKFFKYIIPSIASQFVFTLYTVVDAVFVARGVGASALAAVNVASPFLTIMFAISITIAVGTSTQVARLKGEGNEEKAQGLFSMNFTAAVVASVVIMIIALVIPGPIADLLGATENTRGYVITYLRTVAPFASGFILSYIFEILIATDGFPAKATRTVTIGVVSNFILDYLFIFIFKWGVFGAAFATGIAQMIPTAVYLFHFLGPQGTIKFRRFTFSTEEFAGSLWRGLPSGIMEISPGIITFILVHFVELNLGEDGLVAFSAMAYLAGVVFIVVVGVAQGAQPLVAYYNGAGDEKAIRTLLRYQLVAGIGLEFLMYIIVVLFSKEFASLFLGSDAAYLTAYTAHWMKYYLIFVLVDGFTVVLSITMTGLEKPIPGIVLSGLRATVFLLIACVITTAIGGNAIWFAMLIAEIETVIGSAYVMKKRFG